MKEHEIKKLYFSIGEVAATLKVNVSAIRFYCQEFNIVVPRKRTNNSRIFSQKHVNVLTTYHELLVRGLSIDSARLNFPNAKLLFKILIKPKNGQANKYRVVIA